MANKVIETDINPRDFVNSLSRYANSKVIYYGDNNTLTFTTYKKSIVANSSDDKFSIVPAGMEFRPDLVSVKFYGVSDFWWKIMEANNISDVFDFKAGLNIRLPNSVY